LKWHIDSQLERLVSKIALFLAWGLLGLLLLSACGSSAPTSVAQDLMRGLEEQDQAALRHAYCSRSLADLSSRVRGRIDFQDMSYLERSRQNDTVNVEVRGTVTSAGGTTSIDWELTMKKKGATWCVQSVQTLGHA
jgi:hypothetical protein